MRANILSVLRDLHREESGEESPVGYTLAAALIAFGAVTVLHRLAIIIGSALSIVVSKLISAAGY